MIDKLSSAPIYKQIAVSIRTDIERGVYPIGSKLPSEDTLAAKLDVSRGTLRQALGELEDLGIIKRVHGSGTFVCEPKREYKIESDHFISFLEEIESAGVPVDTVVLGRNAVQAGGILTKVFPEDLPLFEIQRLRKKDGMPIMLSYDYIPIDIAPAIEIRYHDERAIYDFLEDTYGIRVYKVKRTFQASVASGSIAKSLSIKSKTPIFFVIQEGFDEFNRCVVCSKLYLISEGMQFSVVLNR